MRDEFLKEATWQWETFAGNRKQEAIDVFPVSRARLVQSSFGEIAGERWIGFPSLLINGLDSGSA